MFWDDYKILILIFLCIKTISSCGNITWLNQNFGYIESPNYFLEQIYTKNISCQWKINNENLSNFIISLRILDIQINSISWTNELIFRSNGYNIFVDDINQRTFHFSSISELEIDFPIKSPNTFSSSLNIQRFFLEIYRVRNQTDDFHCQKSDLIIPQQWRCNCLYECGSFDSSDEDDCPLCDMIPLSNTFICHFNETWCLPNGNNSSGVCLSSSSSNLISSCSYQTQCETIIVYSQDHGEIILKNSILFHENSLCFIVISKEKHSIQLIINNYNFSYLYSNWKYFIYDGDQKHDQIIATSNTYVTRQIVQTQRNHLVTIVMQKHLKDDQNNILNSNGIALNITWLTSICPEGQFYCGGRFERKCYTKEQRCDGIWNCISGDDELGCLPSSCPTTFACHNQLYSSSDHPRCYNWFERCDGNAVCPNRVDEQNCNSWWCNSNNGTFLCRNGYCIYESWRCDGTNDCGDYSDEIHCPWRISRRIITVIILGIVISATFFLIALGCMCKLINLRTAEQRLTSRLAHSEQYFEQREVDETQHVAPPSYNQTMGFSNETDDRLAILAEQLRLAGLANFIPSRSRERNRQHGLYEENESQSHPFDRLRLLFNRNLSINNNRHSIDEIDISQQPISFSQSVVDSSSESRNLPPPYLTAVTTVNCDEQTNDDEDDDDDDDDDAKLLVP